MARAYGANTKLSGALETEYGTPPAQGVYLQLPFVSMTYGSEQGLLPSDLLGQGRDPLQPSRDVIRVDGDLVAPVDLRYFGYYLKCLFGAPVTTEGVGGDAGKFTHVFKSGAAAVPSMAMELGFPEVPAFFTKVGTVFDAMQIPFARSGNANATFTLIGQGETKASASAVGEVNSLPITRFSQFQGYVKKGATLLGNLTAASLGYSNNCERVETIRPDGKIEGADPAGATLIQQALSRLSPEASQSERDAVTKRAAALYDATEGATKLAEAMKQGEAVTKSNLSATALYAEEIDKLEKLLKAGAISQDTFNAAMGKAWEDSLKKRTDAVAGMQRFNVEYQKQAQDTASAVERFFKNGFTQAESSLAGFLTKGKAGFDELNDFVKTFFNDLTTQWVRTKITAPLMNAITGSSAIEDIISSVFHEGGVVGQGGGQRSVSPLMFANAPRYHTGGVAGLKPGEVPAILEKGEIVIPKGKTLGGGGVNMKVEIINNAPGVTATPSMSADGSVLKVMINSQVNEAIMSGATDKAQRTRFGTPRTMKER